MDEFNIGHCIKLIKLIEWAVDSKYLIEEQKSSILIKDRESKEYLWEEDPNKDYGTYYKLIDIKRGHYDERLC